MEGTYRVWHITDFSNYEPTWPDDYEHVADVAGISLENVYMLTNHIDCSWYDHEEVTCHKKTRSTSVRDVVVDPTGQAYFCEGTGWSEIEDGETRESMGIGQSTKVTG